MKLIIITSSYVLIKSDLDPLIIEAEILTNRFQLMAHAVLGITSFPARMTWNLQ
jgi:hypothetical protein